MSLPSTFTAVAFRYCYLQNFPDELLHLDLLDLLLNACCRNTSHTSINVEDSTVSTLLGAIVQEESCRARLSAITRA